MSASTTTYVTTPERVFARHVACASPTSDAEGYARIDTLATAIRDINQLLALRPEAFQLAEGWTAAQYVDWRRRARDAKRIKERELAGLRVWARQRQHEKAATGAPERAEKERLKTLRAEAVAQVAQTTPDADALLARVTRLLCNLLQEFDPDEIGPPERAVLDLAQAYLDMRKEQRA